MTYRWVYTNDFQQKLYDVGVLPDGTLHNPNNYPEDLVRESIAGAVLRRRRKAQQCRQTGRNNQREAQATDGVEGRSTSVAKRTGQAEPELCDLRQGARRS